MIMETKVSDHFVPTNPGNVDVGTDGGLNVYSPLDGIFDDGVLAIVHCHLERDVGFRIRLIDERDLTERNRGW